MFNPNNRIDNNIIQVNRLTSRAYFIPYPTTDDNVGNLKGPEASARCFSLNGEWSFEYFENAYEAVRSRNGELDGRVNVPELWQFNGIEIPYYVNVAFPYPATPPIVPDCAPAAVYKKTFNYTNEYKRSILTFQGVSAGFDLWLNGKYVGYSQGSHYCAEFDISSLLVNGSNELCVIVYKWTTGSFFECQDMLRSNGIFRDVYITGIAENGIYDVAWRTYGNKCSVDLLMHNESPAAVTLLLTDAEGNVIHSESKDADNGKLYFEFTVDAPVLWNAEMPYLYELSLSTGIDGIEYENIQIPVGFKSCTIEDGIFLVNGTPIKCLGVNHHDATPDRGCALTIDDYIKDFELMKKLNINTIRFAHYVPHPAALELCDRMGFYVIDEADLENHGALFMRETLDYFSNDPKYLPEYLDRMDRLYERDKNHASVILWSLGNESGFGDNHKKCAEFLKQKDKRNLIHYEGAWNWEGENGFDIVSMMYPSPARMCEMMAERPNKPLYLCEYAHAMGVGPGGLQEYIDTFYNNTHSMGGCIWEWCDHAYYSSDKSYYKYGGDGGEWVHDGNFCADGMVRADRDLTPSAHEVKNAYRPFTSILKDNKLSITNRSSFTHSSEYDIKVVLKKDGEELSVPIRHDIAPMQTQDFILPELKGKNVFVELTYLINGECCGFEQHIVARTLPEIENAGGKVELSETERHYVFTASGVQYHLSKDTSTFDKIMKDGKNYLSDKKSLYYNPYCEVNSFVPNIYRYKIDNDMYIRNEWHKYGYEMMWNRVTSREIEKTDFDCRITVESLFSPPKWSLEFKHKFIYSIFGDGTMKVEAILHRMNDELPYLPRYGVLLNPNEQLFDKVAWDGLGPYENYPDAKISAMVAEYESSINDMHYDYVSPQENGERCDISIMILKSSHGDESLSVIADQKFFNFRISDYSSYDLPKAKHIGELVRGEKLELCIDGFMSGIGSNSCGPELPEKDRVNAEKLQFSFIINIK